jgi:hypothetical protein
MSEKTSHPAQVERTTYLLMLCDTAVNESNGRRIAPKSKIQREKEEEQLS